MPQLESLEKWDTSLKIKPDLQYYIAYDFYGLDNYHFHKSPHYGFDNSKFDEGFNMFYKIVLKHELRKRTCMAISHFIQCRFLFQ